MLQSLRSTSKEGSDLAEVTQIGNIIWADHHSHTNKDVTLYSIERVQNAFVSQANCNLHQGTVHMIKGF